MKTKIVYIVVSDSSDYYLEQTLLSVYSLKLHNPSANVELIVDDKTDATIIERRAEILKYINKKIVVELKGQHTKAETSRIIKTTLRKHINGDYLFIDSDTIITDKLDEIDNFDGMIGAVLNLHVPLEQHPKKDEIKVRKRIIQVGYNITNNIPYFNSGVLFVRDCKKSFDFYQLWNEKWLTQLQKSRLYKDQPPMAVANAEMGFIIKELNGKWNCQVLNNGLPYLHNSKIIHYFASVYQGKLNIPYIFLDETIYQSIKNDMGISTILESQIINARGAFTKQCKVISNNDINLLSDNLHLLASKCKYLYKFFDTIANMILFVPKTIKYLLK